MNRSLRVPCLLLLAAALADPAVAKAATTRSSPAVVVPADQVWTATARSLHIRLLPEVLQRLGLALPGAGKDGRELLLALAGSLQFTAATGKLDALTGSTVELRAALQLRSAGRSHVLERLQLMVVPAESGVGVALDAVAADGAVWLRLRNAHALLSADQATLDLRNLGVLAGPALATLLGDARLAGAGLGMARLHANVEQKARTAIQPSSCAVPQWSGPTTPGDVALTALFDHQVMRGFQMDGPGGSDGQVVIAPSATLANVGTRDIPWYTKYQGVFPPYGNDQHPFLLWSLYRMDADGLLVQHARSGVKHAFVTINQGCNCNNNNILGVGCADTYDAFTNDVPFDESCPGYEACTLGPRSEIAPRQGIWGRCGSIYDPNCDGNPVDTQAYSPFEHRMVARETDFDPAANPGSLQWLEGWYLVRDDSNLDNNLGSTSVQPAWIPTGGGGTWSFQGNTGPFVAGPVIERWADAAPAPFASRSTRIASSDGAVHLAVRVTALPGARYRYQYALMNLDFGRAVITGMAPDPTVVRALGLNSLALAGTALQLSATRFADGDRTPGNDWIVASSPGQLQWNAPSSVHLAWGSLLSVSFESSSRPRTGLVTLGIAEPGSPAALTVTTLVPGTDLFADGFEDP